MILIANNQILLFQFTLHYRTDSAKLKDNTVCSKSFLSGETFTNITLLLSSVKYLYKNNVSLQFLNVGFYSFLIALITIPSSVNELFIDLASSILIPVASDSFWRSLPAKSTNTKLLVLFGNFLF